MLSKKQMKLIASMAQKKQRIRSNLFLAEGEKCVNDLLAEGFSAHLLIHTQSWALPGKATPPKTMIEVDKEELIRASLLKAPQNVLALFYQPFYKINNGVIETDLIIALDGIQDPGNLGTIIRIADWFGVEEILCSMDTVDCYNPKVVQATMGAIARVKLHYVELHEALSTYRSVSGNHIFGTFLEGDDIYTSNLDSKGIIVMGNEGSGIRDNVSDMVTKKLYIPTFSVKSNTSESLNVATATAIICSEFSRQHNYK